LIHSQHTQPVKTPLFDCTRVTAAALAALAFVFSGSGRAAAQSSASQSSTSQSPAVSNFNIYVRSAPVGTEEVTVTKEASGWTLASTGRMSPPLDLVIRQFTAKYDASWKPLELSVDTVVRGQASLLKATVSGTSATAELTGAEGTPPQRRTDTIDAQALFLLNPFVAPFEAVAARLATSAPGTTLFFYQPGQGTFTGLVGESASERIQTVARTIQARRTLLSMQSAGQPPMETEVWADESGRLLRLLIPAQGLEVAREDMSAVSTRRLTLSRPNDEDIRIPANGFSLAGTLSKPDGRAGRLPAVVLIPGSGPTDRDETVAGIPVFGQLGNALAEAGFVVVRYDKRGVGQSGGRPESATLTDYAEDVRAIVRALNDRKDVDPRRIALVGHSEGGSLALLVASKERRVAGVALVATAGTTGVDLNLSQVTHALERANRPEAERRTTLDLQRRIQDAVLTGKGWETISVPEGVRRQADTPYFQSFLAFDPAKVMKDVDQPVLIIQGSLDSQVPPENADKLEALARDRKKAGAVDVVKIAGVNHLLVPATTGEVDEYPRLVGARVSPDVISALNSWLTRTLTGR
jgi:pimeloyl-ACP methyl ester carboxylesterase